jgi:YVTN family beta-propeller protein
VNLKNRKLAWVAVQVLLLAVAPAAFAADSKIYVANEDASTVSVIDDASLKATRSINVGKGAHNVQISPDGTRVWVTNNGSPTAADNAAHKGMPVAEHGAMAAKGEVWAIDTATDKVVAKVGVGKHPAHVVLTNDGKFALVTNGGDNTVSVVDIATLKVAASIPTGEFPHGIRVSPDGKHAYVANLKGATVSVIDIESRKEIGQIAVGKGPAQVGFTPDGRFAFVSLSQEGRVAVIDPKGQKVLRTIDVGVVPIQLFATPDSSKLIVANQGTRKSPGKTVSIIDLNNFAVIKTIVTGNGAHGVAIGADGRYAYVTNMYANSVTVVDIQAGKAVRTLAVGRGPNGITVAP